LRDCQIYCNPENKVIEALRGVFFSVAQPSILTRDGKFAVGVARVSIQVSYRYVLFRIDTVQFPNRYESIQTMKNSIRKPTEL
jgi:hypothetical protein